MSARTFRDQSPGRPTSSYSTMSTPAVVPPLPSIPSEYAGKKNQTRRSVSVGPSAWTSSPRHPTEQSRNIKSPVNVPGSPRIVPSTDVPSSPLHQRSESRNSINFSYPMNSRTNSPTAPAGSTDRSDAAHGAAASLNKRASAHYNNTRQQSQGVKSGSPARNPLPVSALAAAQAAIVPRNEEPETNQVPSRQHRQQPVTESSPSRTPVSVDTKSRPPPKKPAAGAEGRPAIERPQPAPVPPPAQSSVPLPTQLPAKEKENQPLVVPSEPPRALTPPVADQAVRTPSASPPQAKLAHQDAESSPKQPSPLRQSSSPPRTAHFPSQLTVMNPPSDHLHQPPARSLSPAKSAMKNRNSSVSPDGRLSGILRPGPPLSELSDVTPVASDDGNKPNNKKKSVKVSFDDEAEIVGVAASPPTSPENPLPMSPPGKSKSKSGWFNLHKRKSSPLLPADGDEFDEVLKPRAALPSFGSVRGNKDGARPETTPPQAPEDGDLGSESDDDFPNGHAISNLVSRSPEEEDKKQVSSHDAPPAISTSVGANNSAESQDALSPSDSDLEPTHFHKTQLSPLPEIPSDQNLPLADETPPEFPEMPDITLQPATPDLEKGRASSEAYDSPEEYPRQSIETGSEDLGHKKGKRRSHEDSAGSPDHDSSSSVYSDAEEDLDEDGGDGFGSINAIIKPETPAEPGVAITTTQDETNRADHRIPSELPETCQIARAETPVQETSDVPDSSPGLVEPLPVSTIPSYPTEPESKTTVDQREADRSSIAPAEVHSIAKVRDEDLHEADTWQSSITSSGNRRGENQKPAEGSTSTKGKGVNSPDTAEFELNGSASLHRRQLSNGSDESTSSFRRSHRQNRGGMGMRMTLRENQQSNPGSAPTRAAKSAESPPHTTGLGAGTMRTTLRNNPSKKKSSFFSTGKSQRAKSGKGTGLDAPFATRFPDSDSESDTGVQNRRLQRPSHRATRSMSDNDMRPVRGIPRRKGAYDGDSTELEDSSDGEKGPSSAPRTSAAKTPARQTQPTTVRDPALAAVAKSRGMTEEELEQILNRGPNGSPRKPNFLNRLRLRKSKPPTQRGKFQLSESLSNLDIPESSQAQEQPSPVLNGTSKGTSRLLKKSQRSQPGDTSWPLASEEAEPVDSGIGSASSPITNQQPARPSTPNGNTVNGTGNKSASQVPFGVTTECQPTQDPEPTGGNRASDVVIEGSGRKKRFQRLKKAFGISG